MRNESTIGDALKAFVKANNLQPKLREVQVKDTWSRMMGQTIAGMTRQIELRNQEVTIHVDSASLRQELTLGREKVLRMLNEELGGDFIKDVVIR
jgi:predicted nucleic acid-binding Zn ribbon protein